MKKTVYSILSAALMLSLAGCSSKPASSAASSAASSVSSETAEQTPGSEVELTTYSEFASAEVDTPVTVETYVQAKEAWAEDKASVYTQNEEGAYFVFEMACSEADYEKLVEGQKIRVSGYKGVWSGEAEIVDATFEILDGNYIAEAADITDLLGALEIVDYMNQKVAFRDLTVDAASDGNAFTYNWDGSGTDGDDLYFYVKDAAGQQYQFTVESKLTGAGTEVYEAVKKLNVGDVIDCEGFLYWYEGINPHITSITVK